MFRYGKFDEYAMIDDQARVVQFSYAEQERTVAITIPHFWHSAGMKKLIIIKIINYIDFNIFHRIRSEFPSSYGL